MWQLHLLIIRTAKYHILFFHVSYKKTQTKINNCTIISLPTLAIHFVCQRFPYFLFHPSYITVQNYHRRLIRNYRSYQIEQQDILQCLSFLDFQQTNFNDFNGVGISTSCFCLNYHLHQLPIHFQATGNDNNSSNNID